jgi:hypothetical protein
MNNLKDTTVGEMDTSQAADQQIDNGVWIELALWIFVDISKALSVLHIKIHRENQHYQIHFFVDKSRYDSCFQF